MKKDKFTNYLNISASIASLAGFIIMIVEKVDAPINLGSILGGFFLAIWIVSLILVFLYVIQAAKRLVKKYCNFFITAITIISCGVILFLLMAFGKTFGGWIYIITKSLIETPMI